MTIPTTDSTALRSIGEMARELDVPLHKVDYIVESRGIQPVGRVGGVRVFDDRALNRVRDELEQVARRKNDWAV